MALGAPPHGSTYALPRGLGGSLRRKGANQDAAGLEVKWIFQRLLGIRRAQRQQALFDDEFGCRSVAAVHRKASDEFVELRDGSFEPGAGSMGKQWNGHSEIAPPRADSQAMSAQSTDVRFSPK